MSVQDQEHDTRGVTGANVSGGDEVKRIRVLYFRIASSIVFSLDTKSERSCRVPVSKDGS